MSASFLRRCIQLPTMITLSLLFLSSPCTGAENLCEALSKLPPSLHNNSEFWVRVSELQNKGNLNNSAIEDLIKKMSSQSAVELKPNPAIASQPPASKLPHGNKLVELPKRNYELSEKAINSFLILQPNLKKKIKTFLELVGDGGESFRLRLTGSWHPHFIKEKGYYVAALDEAYRVAFSVDQATGKVQIIDIGKGLYKH